MNVHQIKNSHKDTVFVAHYHKLQKYCTFLGMNKWEREDIVQETFLKVLEKYEEQAITTSLLKKTAYNYWIDTIRKNRKWKLNQVEEYQKSKEVEIDTLMALAEQLINHLTIKQAIVFLLAEGFSYSLKEVAEVVNISEGAVKSILFRARNTIKQTIIANKENRKAVNQEIVTIFYDALKEEDPSRLIRLIHSNQICLQTATVLLKKPVQNWHAECSMAA
ncbi:MAG: sigma-70 family RNA polymerase sigma factor [Bacillus sp. (in: firmicutes)]